MTSRRPVNRKCQAGALIHDLKVTDGSMAAYNNNGITFSWTKGGFEKGTPPIAQVGEIMDTLDAVFSGAPKGKPAGGFVWAVDILDVKVPTHVYLGLHGLLRKHGGAECHADSCGWQRRGVLYVLYTMPAKTTGPSFLTTLTIPPSKVGQTVAGKRTLTGTWQQTAADAATVARNIQWHSIAVDAGGPVAASTAGAEVACSHNKLASNAGSAILQAAVLA